VPGAHGSGGQWSVILPVAQALLADLERLSRPGFLDRRTDHWARGDRVAWSHSVVLQQPPFNALTNRLVDLREDENLPSQVIHSDIYGNVLFHPHAVPAVIDLSPMWRPAGYCLAIAAVDAIAWYSAPRAILNDLLDLKSVRSLLARAAIFRLATADRFAATSAEQTHYVTSTVTEFTPVIEAIENL
jgi:hypothetical protein